MSRLDHLERGMIDSSVASRGHTNPYDGGSGGGGGGGNHADPTNHNNQARTSRYDDQSDDEEDSKDRMRLSYYQARRVYMYLRIRWAKLPLVTQVVVLVLLLLIALLALIMIWKLRIAAGVGQGAGQGLGRDRPTIDTNKGSAQGDRFHKVGSLDLDGPKERIKKLHRDRRRDLSKSRVGDAGDEQADQEPIEVGEKENTDSLGNRERRFRKPKVGSEAGEPPKDENQQEVNPARRAPRNPRGRRRQDGERLAHSANDRIAFRMDENDTWQRNSNGSFDDHLFTERKRRLRHPHGDVEVDQGISELFQKRMRGKSREFLERAKRMQDQQDGKQEDAAAGNGEKDDVEVRDDTNNANEPAGDPNGAGANDQGDVPEAE
eukprot:CAMPEP_0184706452 /NCGR_PEP_ID=MMETSP0313-20130426/36766_1 /TAXON_ID=2792 /ORGANISM="Porphyridium aerugineum, Strain SAG 1380-2" /LENGTH=376 /DNA_ID=CAMNT_0027168005 /DNA_START=153 /DNA_END=1283 /DNA_ORIENTATION=-